MSGHSKWSTIKHKKGADDKRRGKLFAKLSRAIIVAAKEGGGDPDGQRRRSRPLSQKARDVLDAEGQHRARDQARAPASSRASTYESVTYEGYAPDGVAVFVEALTDNRNRTGAESEQRLHAATAARSPSRARWRGSSSARA